MRIEIIKLLSDLAKNKNTFTFKDAYNTFNTTRKATKDLLSRLEKSGVIERIEKGKYMVIPLGVEKGKYTLHEFVIGSLLVKPFAIAYWSALNFYELTEQIPTTVFIQMTARKRQQEKEIFGVKYNVTRIKETKFFGIRKEWIEETEINITDREKTVIDCPDKPQYCGGIIEVAKALRNGKLNKKKLSEYAIKINNSGVVRKLGSLCDEFNIKIKLPKVNVRNYLYLDSTMPHEGTKNAKWRLIINTEKLATLE